VDGECRGYPSPWLELPIIAPLNHSLTFTERSSRFDENHWESTMDETTVWDELTRLEQRALIKLFGGGTVRNDHPIVVEELRTRGLVDESDNLSMPGLMVLKLAIRKQQAQARSRMGLAA
jgi:hypothetical protein